VPDEATSDSDGLAVEPEFSPEEREELGHLRYFESRLVELEARGLISRETLADVGDEDRARTDAIHHTGRVRAALGRAGSLASQEPESALALAEKVRAVAPDRAEVWELIVDILWRAGRDEEAVVWCEEAGERFPRFACRAEELRAELPARAERRRAEAERVEQEALISDRMAQAKQALDTGRDHDVIDACSQVLSLQPDHVDASAFAAFALQRSGRVREALERYRHLQLLQPSNTAWAAWVRELSHRRRFEENQEVPTATDALGSEAVGPSRPSWASVSGEFLQEHWQKLILCLAVLLIVVSSTIGAHALLGPRLWSPVGKCALALMVASLLAAMGTSLARWGAALAGEIMLVTTLIVAPIHFMLAGELGLLSDLSAANLGVAVVDLLAVVGLTRMVAGQLATSRQAWFLTSSIALISASNVVAVNDLASRLWPIGAFEAPAIVFFAAIALLRRRPGLKPSQSDDSARFLELALGLLSFAMLASVLRIGAYELKLEPAYFAVPLMFAAGACVLLSGRLRAMKLHSKGSYLGRLGLIGFSLSAPAFALALGRPSGDLRAFDGNTLAVAVLGVAMYGASLRDGRHPAYLYLSLAAFALASVAFLDVVIGPERPLEIYLGRLLGYPGKPPFAFRSIPMIGFNAVLAGLVAWFSKRWNDDRLAWHCHAIGLPVSIAACVLSGFEPKAAVICLTSYTALYLIAARVYQAPRLTYLAIAVLTGAVTYFDLAVTGDLSYRASSIEGSVLGLGCWVVAFLILREGAQQDDEERRPWLMGSLVLALVALVLAALDQVNGGTLDLGAAGMFLAVSFLLMLLTREFPRPILVHLALGSLLAVWIIGFDLALGRGVRTISEEGLAFTTFGLALLGVAAAIRATVHLDDRRSRALRLFAREIPRFVIATVLVVEAAQCLDLGRTRSEALVFALGSASLIGSSVTVRIWIAVYAGLACAAAAVASFTWWIAPHGDGGMLAGWVGIAAGLTALAFWGAAMVGRRRSLPSFFVTPCLRAALVMTGIAYLLAIQARVISQDAFVPSLIGLILDCVVILLIGTTWESASLTYYGVAAFVAASYVFLLSVGEPDPSKSFVLGTNAEIQGLVLWFVGFACGRLGDRWTRLYARPLFVSSLVLTVGSVPLAYWSPTTMALAAVSFLLMVKSFPRAEWLYASVATLGLSAYYGYFIGRSWSAWLIGLVGAAYGLWVVALIVRKCKPALCRLGAPESRYEFVLADSAVVLALVAMTVRIAWSAETGLPGTAHAAFPLALAGLAFLLRFPYQSPVSIHAGFGLLTWLVVSASDPLWPSPVDLAASTAILAFLSIFFAHFTQLQWIQDSLPRRDWLDSEALIAYGWSFYLWVFSSLLTATIIIVCVAFAILPELWVPALKIEPIVWSRLTGALVANLGAFRFLVAAQADDTLHIGSVRITDARFGMLQALAWVWWIAAGPSFTSGGLIPWPGYLPLATALYAAGLLTAIRYGESRGSIADPFLERMVYVTAILAAFFTRGTVGTNSMIALAVSSIALGGLGLTSRSREIGRATSHAAGLAWMAALAMAGLEVARRSGWNADGLRATGAAVGLIAAGHSLLPLSAFARRFQFARQDGPQLAVGREWTIASERIAFLGSLVAAACVTFAATSPASTGPSGTLVGVGVLAAVVWLLIVLAGRWTSEALVYLAQGMLLGTYVVYRQTFPAPIATDAILLTLLAYLDFGIAEAIERMGLTLYSRPMRFVSFALPLLPLVPMLSAGKLDGIGMFHLLAAGTFYGVAFSATRWRPLGYAAAVVYNAALWVWWGRLGWTLADDPQFYFVPVGLSTILFAEANRRDLGASAVNAVRSVGLVLIYLATAFPIWNNQSFGAWLTLLVLSLLGIFAGIGLRARVFLWMGLATFLLDITYQLVRFSADHAVAKWGIMLGLGIALFLFVALNEKKRIVGKILDYYEQIQAWE
jgi:tetratricopeptide (TPR) repeat protein